MGIVKHGEGEVLADGKTAAALTEADRQALAQENEEADGDDVRDDD